MTNPKSAKFSVAASLATAFALAVGGCSDSKPESAKIPTNLDQPIPKVAGQVGGGGGEHKNSKSTNPSTKVD